MGIVVVEEEGTEEGIEEDRQDVKILIMLQCLPALAKASTDDRIVGGTVKGFGIG